MKEVYTKRKKNRHLKDTHRDIVHGGFRGTSWVEMEELCDQITEAYVVTGNMTEPVVMDNN